jgi:hypothetical protein
MEKYELGLNKKSFSLFYNNGEIWGEHLDSLYDKRELLIQKFNQDMEQMRRPSTSSFIAIDLDDSEVDIALLEFIISSFVKLEKPIRKIVFVGLNSKLKKYVKIKNKDTLFEMTCIDDYEKAKEWLV